MFTNLFFVVGGMVMGMVLEARFGWFRRVLQLI